MYIYRHITDRDVELICNHRERMFLEAGHAQERLTVMTRHYRPWLEVQLSASSYFGYVALEGDLAIGSVGWMMIDWPPHPLHPEQPRRGYVLNLFVEPTHRGKGVGGELMSHVDAEFQAQGIQYSILHSTASARGMYEKFGWSGTSEMARTYT